MLYIVNFCKRINKESTVLCNYSKGWTYWEIKFFSLGHLDISKCGSQNYKFKKKVCCQPAVRMLPLGSGKMLINQSSVLWGTGQWPLCSTGWRSHICQPWSICCPCSLLLGPDPMGSRWKKEQFIDLMVPLLPSDWNAKIAKKPFIATIPTATLDL